MPDVKSWSWLVGQRQGLRFTTTEQLDLQSRHIQHLSAHLPGFKPVPTPSENTLVTVRHTSDGARATIRQEPGEVHVDAPVADIFPGTLPHLLYGACRAQWLRQNRYPVHAACIGSSERGYYLLAGPSGSGKTSLVMEHARQQLQYDDRHIFSADKTLVRFTPDGQLKAIAGTQTLSVRHGDMPRWQGIDKQGETLAGDRTVFRLPAAHYAESDEVDVNGIYLVALNDKPLETPLDADSARHQLFPLFLDKQREDILVGKHDCLLDGTVPRDSKAHLGESLKKYLQTAVVRRVHGSLYDVYQAIMPTVFVPDRPLAPACGKKILFGICGIGNGHLSRQLPGLHELMKNGHQIVVFTYGQALEYFTREKSRYQDIVICEVNNPYIPGHSKGLDFEASGRLSQNNASGFMGTNFAAMAVAEKHFGTPDLVISDYEQVAAQYAYSKQAPLVTLDQQSKFLTGDLPEELAGTSFKDEQERLSLFFPHAEERLALSFFKVRNKEPAGGEAGSDRGYNHKVTILPPVLRSTICEAARSLDETDPSPPALLFYITSQSWSELPIGNWIDTLRKHTPDGYRVDTFLPRGCSLPQDCRTMKFYPHGDARFDAFLIRSRGVISTAGHTLLSEAMHLAKPVYAIPLRLYEQQLNAKVIGDNQFGVTTPDLTAQGLRYFVANLDRFSCNIRNDRDVLLRGDAKGAIMQAFNSLLADRKKNVSAAAAVNGQVPESLSVTARRLRHRRHAEYKFAIPDLDKIPLSIKEAVLSGKDHPDVIKRGVVIQKYIAPTRENISRVAEFLTERGIPFGSHDEIQEFLEPGYSHEVRLIHRYLKDREGRIIESYQVRFGDGQGEKRDVLETPENLGAREIRDMQRLFDQLEAETRSILYKLHVEMLLRNASDVSLSKEDGSPLTAEIDIVAKPVAGSMEAAFSFLEVRNLSSVSNAKLGVQYGKKFNPEKTNLSAVVGKDISTWERARARHCARHGAPAELLSTNEELKRSNNDFANRLFSSYKRWLPGNLVQSFLHPLPITQLRTDKKIVLNAEPFGFGPSAATAEVFSHLREHASHVAYIGEQHTLDIQRKYPYDAVIDCSVIEPDEGQDREAARKAAYAFHLRQYDILITASNFEIADLAKEQGLRVVIYDPLTWYWDRIPAAITRADLYLAQNFLMVEDRIKIARELFPSAIAVVPPLISGFQAYRENTECTDLLVNTGGLKNPFTPSEALFKYATVIMGCVDRTLRRHYRQTHYLGSRDLDMASKEFDVKTLRPLEVQNLLQQSDVAIMTPGLGNIFEASTLKKKVIWLPPANDSQGQQLRLLQRYNMTDAHIDWHDILHDEEPVDYFSEQKGVLKLIANRINRMAHDTGAQKVLCQRLTQARQQLEGKETLALSALAERFSRGGGRAATDEILQWIHNQDPAHAK